jgi:heme exporter protein C
MANAVIPENPALSPAARNAGRIWFFVSLMALAYGAYNALLVAPTEATMGNIQRIFYWHVPVAMVAEVFPFINLAASIWVLATQKNKPEQAWKADAWALASAELTVLFVGLGLISGMLWARPVWGIWWTWDERLTTFLLLFVLYVAYLVVRRFSAPGHTSTLAAVISIFAAVDVPICFMSITWFRTQHPSPVLRGDGQLDPVMKHVWLLNIIAWSIWGTFLLCYRYLVERKRQAVMERAVVEALGEPVYGLPEGAR